MNKSELLKTLSEKTGQSQNVVNSVLNGLIETVVTKVRDEDDVVSLPGLGTFKQKKTPARDGINPLNKTKIHIDASRTIQFKVMHTLKVKD